MRFSLLKTALLAASIMPSAMAYGQQTSSKQGFIPKGYRPLIEAKGDLNKDGIPDLVMVVENADPQNIILKKEGLGPDTLNLNDRKILVLLGTGAGNFRKVAENGALIPPESSEEQPCLSDPLMQDGGISISKGVLKVDLHYWYSCGSWYVTRHTYTLRLQECQMQLIGFDASDFHRASGESSTTSINFSTGKRQDVTGENMFDGPSNPKTTWRALKNRKPIYLEDLSEESAEWILKL